MLPSSHAPLAGWLAQGFSKYQGLGNDFLLIDARTLGELGSEEHNPEAILQICDRRFGVGADGLILALPPRQGGELRMRIFNADGSEPEMCGNGIRCLARFLADRDGDAPGRRWLIETLAGTIVPELQADGSVRVDMGPPFLSPETVPTTLAVGPAGLPQGVLMVAGQTLAVAAAGMGNPHVVIPVADLDAVDLETLGPLLEQHDAFPARTNVHFVQVLSPNHLRMRVWERGAGPTLACGTGACATLVACHLLGLAERRARLDLPGGALEIEWDGASGPVWMTGPAEAVFHGQLAHESDLAEANPAKSVPAEAESAGPSDAELPQAAAIDCAVACVQGCVRPEACPNAEARARVQQLLERRSLDELVAIATNSLEDRLLGRLPRDGGRAG
ncbi:MAG: diaminopimelate epimerase [Cyanobium sp. 49614_E6]|nr:diaminopimelate epimerase [Cyanobium sp. 49614_E6]MCE2838607.1 diaminopimelate epimerase [Cyanobium sp. 49614_E6]